MSEVDKKLDKYKLNNTQIEGKQIESQIESQVEIISEINENTSSITASNIPTDTTANILNNSIKSPIKTKSSLKTTTSNEINISTLNIGSLANTSTELMNVIISEKINTKIDIDQEDININLDVQPLKEESPPISPINIIYERPDDDDEFDFSADSKTVAKSSEEIKDDKPNDKPIEVKVLPERKKLKPSQRQLDLEKANTVVKVEEGDKEQKNEINILSEGVAKTTEVKSEVASPSKEPVGVQATVLKKILPPTTILNQYLYASNSKPTENNVEPESIEMVTEAEQWEKVEELRAAQLLVPVSIQPENTRDFAITYDEAVLFFKTYDLESFAASITIYDFSHCSFFTRLLYSCMGAPALPTDQKEDVRRLFLMAKQPMAYEIDQMERILQTLYRLTSGDKFSSSRFGSHWQELGFQGDDPATDLRGSGMLGLLQMLYLFKFYSDLGLRMYQFSKSQIIKDENFPFALVGLNLTGICLNVLRECSLYSLFSEHGVMDTINIFYVSLFYDFFLTWKNTKATILNFSDIKTSLEGRAHLDPIGIITRFKESNKIKVDMSGKIEL